MYGFRLAAMWAVGLYCVAGVNLQVAPALHKASRRETYLETCKICDSLCTNVRQYQYQKQNNSRR